MLSLKSTKFGSRYLVDRLSEGDKMWHIGSLALLYISAEIGELWPRSHPGVPKY